LGEALPRAPLWAVENAGGLGRHLAQRLSAAGESVVDVPPKLSARVRVLSSFAGNSRKNDRLDALATAFCPPRATSDWQRSIPRPPRKCCACSLRGAYRPGCRAYPDAQGSLHGLLRDLVPGGVAGALSTHRAARILRGIRPQGTSDRLRRRLASEVLRDIQTLDRKIADLERRIEAEVEAFGTTLTEIFGIGPILAAKIIGMVGTVVRFPTKAHFASYAGTAPALRPQAGRWCATGSRWPATASSTERPAHGRGMPGQVGRSRRELLPQEDGGGQVPQGSAAVPQEACLRCRLQEPPGGLASAFAQRRLTKRSREFLFHALG
jgi:hypothetical protein